MSIYIPSLEAKDLVSNNQYTLYYGDTKLNTRKFTNTLDYSLDLIKLQAVYKTVYRNRRFSTRIEGKDYSFRVINVTFKYSLKEWNPIGNGSYKHYLTGDIIPEEELPKQNKTIYDTSTLRNIIYKDGFMCDGIHYVRYKRSAGSSRVGKCLFIDARLYPSMHKHDLTGLKINTGDSTDLAALEAYIALTLSSIIDTIQIDPRSILLVDDQESTFTDTVASTELIDNKLNTSIKECTITNSLFDGESLLDSSIFEEADLADKGCILVRKNFFKSCCFNTNIQEFFKDNGITELNQLNGKTLASSVEEIKMITTPSSIKYLKFGSFEQWVDNIDSTFGIVKHEKPTHFFDGRMVQTHYQLLNTLQLSKDEMMEFLEPSIKYMELIKNDPAALKYKIHLADSEEIDLNDSSDTVFQLMDINEEFTRTSLYCNFRKNLLTSMKNLLRSGHVLVEGNYSTLFGNPMEYLLHSIGKFDGTSTLRPGEVMNIRFNNGEKLLGSRSPHVTMGNVLLCRNVYVDNIRKYFNLSNEIVCINAINDNILERLSGADYDSDTMLITNNKILIQAAERNYDKFPVPTSNVHALKRNRYYTDEEKSDLDIKTGKNKIGDIVNLSQDFNSIFWDKYNSTGVFDTELYCDIAQLDVMSTIEIDMAKKEFSFSNMDELRRLKEKRIQVNEESGLVIKPYFFKFLSKQKGYKTDTKYYKKYKTSMDYLHEIIDSHRYRGYKKQTPLPLTAIISCDGYESKRVTYDIGRRFFDYIVLCKSTSFKIWNSNLSSVDKYVQYTELMYAMNNTISKMKINTFTLYWILKQTETETYKRYGMTVWNLLCKNKHDLFMELINGSKKGTPTLVEVDNPEDSDTKIYDYYFKHEERIDEQHE